MRLPEECQSRRLEIRRSMRQTAIAFALWFGIALHAASSEAGEGACSADAKLANIDLTLKDIHGKPFTLSDYKGKVILLDFWATWCPPCRKEIPGFMELYDTYSSRGFTVIGVSIDDSVSAVKKF